MAYREHLEGGAPANSDDVATVSSGNVYEDLGFEAPGLELLKADIVIGIMDEIERRGLSQAEAGRIMGLSQPDVSKLLRGRTGGYSLDRLLTMTRALGNDVEITVKRHASEPANDPVRPGKVALRLCVA